MSSSRNLLCDCGNKATVRVSAQWICERCKYLDSQYMRREKTNKKTCGKGQWTMVNETYNVSAPWSKRSTKIYDIPE